MLGIGGITLTGAPCASVVPVTGDTTNWAGSVESPVGDGGGVIGVLIVAGRHAGCVNCKLEVL
jgi:hypothetical protein